MSNFGRGQYKVRGIDLIDEKHLCVTILNLDQWIRCCVKLTFFFSSAGHCLAEPFRQSYEDHLDELNLNLGQWPSGLGGRDFPTHLKLVSGACLTWGKKAFGPSNWENLMRSKGTGPPF